MDFTLKQWRDEQQQQQQQQQQHDESEDEHQQPSAKIPRNHQHLHHQQQQHHVATALPLFVSEPHSSTLPSSFPTCVPSSFSRVGGRNCFSIAQWQELEVQALIYRHMVAGATIPADLLYLLKNSLLSSSPSSPYYLHHYPPHFQPAALMQGGYWGKGAMDPEPGRCRRTDGKKWRCSRDIVAGHKYCERHVHRGRNRSRKPVEFPAAAATGSAIAESLTKPSPTFTAAAAPFSLPPSGVSSFDAFHLHTGSEELRSDKKNLFDTQHDSPSTDAKSNKVLMHFFDDWPRSLHDSDNPQTNANNLSSTSLSISTPTPGNSSSDFLKLSTGNADDLGNRDGYATPGRDPSQISWTGAWAGNPVVSMGGPLAEALRSSSNSSPTGYHCSTPVA